MTETPQQGTLRVLLEDAKRKSGSFPLRRAFVQGGILKRPTPGPLATFVRGHDDRGLDLFLLHRALASSDPWDVARAAPVWARALGLATAQDTGAAAVSRTWRRLEERKLVVRERTRRMAKVTALCEDGSGSAYTDPSTTYFRVPFAWWTAEQEWHRTLSLPAKAVLLIAMSLKPGFVLPQEKARAWYGISADTAGAGLKELQDLELLGRQVVTKEDFRSPTGESVEIHYTLREPFTRVARAGATPPAVPDEP